MDAALHHFEGEKPTPEAIAKLGARMARLNEIDPSQRGRAVKVGDNWRPRAMFLRGRLTKRQYVAACRLAELYETGFGSPLPAVDYQQPRVDTSRRQSSGPSGMLDASRFYSRAMSALPDAMRAVVERVVLHGHTIESAAKHKALDAPWLPSTGERREVAASVLLGAALEILAASLH